MRVVAAMHLVRQQGCTCQVEVGSNGYFLIKHGTTKQEKRIPLATFLEMDKQTLLGEVEALSVQKKSVARFCSAKLVV